jgi:hypothetical protein
MSMYSSCELPSTFGLEEDKPEEHVANFFPSDFIAWRAHITSSKSTTTAELYNPTALPYQ